MMVRTADPTVLALIGLTHCYVVEGNIVDFLFFNSEVPKGSLAYRGWGVATGYALIAIAFFGFGLYYRTQPKTDRIAHH